MKRYTNDYFQQMIEENEAGKKLTTGEAYAWNFSKGNNSSMFECEDFPSERDMEDFVWALRNAGVDYLAITEQSTALMRIMHQLRELNCKFERFDEITRIKDRFGTVEETKHQAVIFYVPVL